MSLLSHFFIAEASDSLHYDSGRGAPAEDRAEFRRLTPLEAAGMLAVLRSDGDPPEILAQVPYLACGGSSHGCGCPTPPDAPVAAFRD